MCWLHLTFFVRVKNLFKYLNKKVFPFSLKAWHFKVVKCKHYMYNSNELSPETRVVGFISRRFGRLINTEAFDC